MQGNEACAEGAIAAGCSYMAGYPVTPATEIAERLAANNDITVKKAITTTNRFVALNPKYAPLANQKVRQALAYGLDLL